MIPGGTIPTRFAAAIVARLVTQIVLRFERRDLLIDRFQLSGEVP